MSDKTFKLNEKELRLFQYLLSRLEKRIYLLRVSLYGETEKYFSNGVVAVSQEIMEQENDYFKNAYNLSAEEYKLMVDSCEIETSIRRVLHEMEKSQTFKSLKDVVMEFENESINFKKHQKMIRSKEKQIEQLKEVLSVEQSRANELEIIQDRNLEAEVVEKKIGNKVESFCETEFLKKLWDHKVQSRKNYYDYKQSEIEERIEWFQRESKLQVYANAQTISFWLLKYDVCTENLDIILKKKFDNWAAKEREYAILKKFRSLNLERAEKLHKLISERDEYIEKYRIRKEKQQKEAEENLRREDAATKIQAYWRGTMVRKHLGPYKIKKKAKKGKKDKGGKVTGTKKVVGSKKNYRNEKSHRN